MSPATAAPKGGRRDDSKGHPSPATSKLSTQSSHASEVEAAIEEQRLTPHSPQSPTSKALSPDRPPEPITGKRKRSTSPFVASSTAAGFPPAPLKIGEMLGDWPPAAMQAAVEPAEASASTAASSVPTTSGRARRESRSTTASVKSSRPVEDADMDDEAGSASDTAVSVTESVRSTRSTRTGAVANGGVSARRSSRSTVTTTTAPIAAKAVRSSAGSSSSSMSTPVVETSALPTAVEMSPASTNPASSLDAAASSAPNIQPTAAATSKTKRPLKGRAATLAAARIAREAAQAEAAAAAAALTANASKQEGAIEVTELVERVPPGAVGRPSALVLAESDGSLNPAESPLPVVSALLAQPMNSGQAKLPSGIDSPAAPIGPTSAGRRAGRLIDYAEDGVDEEEEDEDDEVDTRPATNHVDEDAMDVDSDADNELSTSVARPSDAPLGDEPGDEEEDNLPGPAVPTPTPSSPVAVVLPSISPARGSLFKRGRGGRGRGRGRGGSFLSAPTTATTSARTSPDKEDEVDQPPASDPAAAGSSSLAKEAVPVKQPRSRKAQELKALKRQRDYERAVELDAELAELERLRKSVESGKAPYFLEIADELADRRERAYDLFDERYAAAQESNKRVHAADEESIWTWWQDARDKLAREQCYQTCSKMSELSRDYQKLLIAQLPPAERTGHIPIHLGGGDRHAPNPRYPTTTPLYPNHPALAKRLRLTVPGTDASVRWASEEDIEDDLAKLGLGRAAKEKRARKEADRARREADRARREERDRRERESQQRLHPPPGQPMPPPGMLLGPPPPNSGPLPPDFEPKREFAWGESLFPPGGFYGPPPPGIQPMSYPPPGQQPPPPPPLDGQQRPIGGGGGPLPPPPPPPGSFYGYPPPMMGPNGHMLLPHPVDPQHWEQHGGGPSRSPFGGLPPPPPPPMASGGGALPPPNGSQRSPPFQPTPPPLDGKTPRPHHHHHHHPPHHHHHHPMPPHHHHHHLAPPLPPPQPQHHPQQQQQQQQPPHPTAIGPARATASSQRPSRPAIVPPPYGSGAAPSLPGSGRPLAGLALLPSPPPPPLPPVPVPPPPPPAFSAAVPPTQPVTSA